MIFTDRPSCRLPGYATARERGLSLTGPDGLLKQLTKTVIETALNDEITEHLGYEKNDRRARGRAAGMFGTRPGRRRC